MDLQGIHSLPELAEVKAVICRITKPEGWVVLNADDRYVAPISRSVHARVALFTLLGDRSRPVARHLARGGRAYLVRDGVAGEAEGREWRPIATVGEMPITIGGAARHNIANALAAAGGARALGASIEDVRRGLLDFDAGAASSPGRMNVFRHGERIVIVDFAHNEAGLTAVLDVAQALAGSLGARGGRRSALAAVIGTAGDRPQDTLRGIGRIAASRVDRLALKETLTYLRGRSRGSVLAELRVGAHEGGWRTALPVFESESAALRAELERVPEGPEVLVVLCHTEREELFAILRGAGFEAVASASALAALATASAGP
jgi:cyanophycin synthetase